MMLSFTAGIFGIAILFFIIKRAMGFLQPETVVFLSKAGNKLMQAFVFLAAAATMGALLWIIGYIVVKGIGSINATFLLTEPFQDGGGILPMILTTVWMVGLSLLFAVPVGIFSAIYLSEYAPKNRMVSLIRFCIESLAGIPSILYGLFGMLFFVTMLKLKYSLLSGALTVAIMVLPVVIRTTEEALFTVPQSLREGSLALGASKIRTIVKVVLPTAVPGILSGVILSIGRIMGETAAIYLTAGMAPRLPGSMMESGRTLSVHLYLLAKEGISFEMAYATATVLIIIVAAINLLANASGKMLGKKLGGERE